MTIWSYLTNAQTMEWLVTTLWLAAVPIVVGLAVALPIGWVASRYRWSYPPIVSIFGILYTIPSLVLFLVLPGILGTGILSPVNVAVALTVYTIALLARTVADGLSSVSQDTLAAAAAMGYTSRQRLLKVQLPLALPVIGAGLRVAAVSNVSLISVGSVIGVSQLGGLFVTGYVNSSVTPTIAGLIWFVVIALVFDAIVLLVVRSLTPWQRAVSAR
ncbi:ABC transporter permease subunit [Nakamurella sp. A5-74]|uniref:ABC transporter permease subunit n=1 Tax=Nakamurella sp. A5-74 TaxID=3158264 RepID=A0AAU8DN21_9ACTN